MRVADDARDMPGGRVTFTLMIIFIYILHLYEYIRFLITYSIQCTQKIRSSPSFEYAYYSLLITSENIPLTK
jgi:hypothetical protein